MAEINNLDVVADNNNAAPPDGFPENMNYRDVNNAARELMALIARWFADTNGSLTATGTANAITLTTNATYDGLFDGLTLVFEAANTNTAATTLTVNALTTQAIVDRDGNALGGGEIVSGGRYHVNYDSAISSFRLMTGSAVLATASIAVDLVNGSASLVVGGVGTAPHIEMDERHIQAKANATSAATLELQRFGGNLRLGARSSGAGQVELYRDQTLALVSETTGVSIRGASNSNTRYEIDDTAGTRRAVLGFSGSDVLLLENEVTGEDININTPDQITLQRAGAVRLQTELNGASVGGPADNRQQMFFVATNGSTVRGFVGFVGGDVLEIENEVDGGNVQISASDAGGTVRNILIADPDGAASLYHPDADTNPAVTTQELIGNNSTAATVRHRSGSDFDVGVGVHPQIEITGNTTLAGNHVQAVLIWRAGTITFPEDTDIPIGTRGLIIADFDVLNATLLLAPAVNITLTLQNGLGNQNFTTLTPSTSLSVGDGGVVEWYKRANTQYHIFGVDIVPTP